MLPVQPRAGCSGALRLISGANSIPFPRGLGAPSAHPCTDTPRGVRTDTKLREIPAFLLCQRCRGAKFYLAFFPSLLCLLLVVLWRISDRLWGCPAPGFVLWVFANTSKALSYRSLEMKSGTQEPSYVCPAASATETAGNFWNSAARRRKHPSE